MCKRKLHRLIGDATDTYLVFSKMMTISRGNDGDRSQPTTDNVVIACWMTHHHHSTHQRYIVVGYVIGTEGVIPDRVF